MARGGGAGGAGAEAKLEAALSEREWERDLSDNERLAAESLTTVECVRMVEVTFEPACELTCELAGTVELAGRVELAGTVDTLVLFVRDCSASEEAPVDEGPDTLETPFGAPVALALARAGAGL